jgi:hypothetical protein
MHRLAYLPMAYLGYVRKLLVQFDERDTTPN